MKNTNWLADIFTYIHEVITEADRPISLVAMVLLPFIAPLLPAMITASSLQKYMEFDSSWAWISVISFELLGYLGMVSVVGAMMRFVKNTDESKVEALRWNRDFYVIAYMIYIATLITSNIILEIQNGVPMSHVAVIFCLTVGLSIGAGILNASRIYDRNENDENNKLRQEEREFKLEKFRIKHGKSSGTNTEIPQDFRNNNETSRSTSGNMGRPSIHQERVFEYMEQYYTETKKVPTFTDVMKNLNLPQSTASRLRDKWIGTKKGEQ